MVRKKALSTPDDCEANTSPSLPTDSQRRAAASRGDTTLTPASTLAFLDKLEAARREARQEAIRAQEEAKTPSAAPTAPAFADATRLSALRRIGLDRASALLNHGAVRRAREIVAQLRAGEESSSSVEKSARTDSGTPPDMAKNVLGQPVGSLHEVTEFAANTLGSIGVHTVADLAALAQEAEDQVAKHTLRDEFYERPSAPPELMPEMIGSVSSTVRYATFVEEVHLEGIDLVINERCVKSTGLSEVLVTDFSKTPYRPEKPYSVSAIFRDSRCLAVRLGFLLDHRQRFVNLGTHLGEVSHSLCLAPGESRHIATVNWRRRQFASLEQQANVEEHLSARFVQNRALEEVAGAVAAEHQFGATSTEANTSATAGALVGAFAVVGGIAGGVTGAVIGGVAGAPTAGSMSVPWAIFGGAAGAAAGGAAGMAAGGLVWAGANALGMIEASSEGDREVAGRVNQRISLSTSQTASASRSLWGSSVLEDDQAENVDVRTRVVTNYNHMHSLNIEYFEVLQHYLATIELERAEPILYLPFTHLPFTPSFDFVRDYWDAIREHVDDDLRHQGDQFFVTEGQPSAPDLKPVPPVPIPPTEAAEARIANLVIDVVVTTEGAVSFADLQFVDFNCEVVRGVGTITPSEETHFTDGLNAGERGFRFTYPTNISNAVDVSGVRIDATWPFVSNIKYRIRVQQGALRSGDTQIRSVAGDSIATNRTLKADTDKGLVRSHGWAPASQLVIASTTELIAHQSALAARNQVIAENEAATLAFEALVRDINRFHQRLIRLILRRRHFFTRVILSALEPEEVESLIGSIEFSVADSPRIRLREIAHPRPIGMTTGAFVLRMKTLDAKPYEHSRANKHHALFALTTWSNEVYRRYGSAKERAAYSRSEHIYLPTGGLFAEAILGRANAAEYLDMERYFDWQSSPIPHQATAIQTVSTDTRYQQPPDLGVKVPDGTINMIQPVSFPDSTGLRDVLGAVQNGAMFRDMSKAQELTSILGSLAQLAGNLGEQASQMTGAAGEQALKQAGEIGKSVSDMASQMMSDSMTQAGSAFSSMTKQGATLNQVRKQFPEGAEQNEAVRRVTGIGSGSSGPSTGSTGTESDAPPTSESPGGGSGGESPNPPVVPFTSSLPALPPPGSTPRTVRQPTAIEQPILDQMRDLLVPNANGLPVGDSTQFEALFEQWYSEGVKPGLIQAASDDRVLISALGGWLEWSAQMQVLGVEPDAASTLGTATDEARLLARAGLRNAVLQANERAAQTNDWHYLLDALEWAANAELLGLGDDGDRLSISEVLQDFDLRITLFNVVIPPQLAIGSPSIVRLSAGLQIANNPPITGEPLEWSLTTSGGSASPPTNGTVNISGGFSTTVLRDQDDFELRVRVVFNFFGGVEVRTLDQVFTPGLP